MEPSRGRRSGEKSTAMRGAWRERAAAQLATPAHSSVGPATNAGGGIIAGITGTVTRPPHRARLEFATSGRGPIRAAAARGRGHPRSPPGRAPGRRTAKGMAAPKARLRPKHGCAQSTAAPKARLRPKHGCAQGTAAPSGAGPDPASRSAYPRARQSACAQPFNRCRPEPLCSLRPGRPWPRRRVELLSCRGHGAQSRRA
jgi:hypothetical protein